MSSIEKAIERMNKEGSSEKKLQNAGAAVEARVVAEQKTSDVDQEVSQKNRLDNPPHHIDLHRLELHGFLTPDAERSKLAEEYRMLKRPLLMNAQGKGAAPVERGNLIMVVSSMPGEGKTFTSINLGMSMAMELDSTVLLVDSDVIKSSLSKELGLDDKPGLIDVLLDDHLDIGDVIVNTDIPKLRVLPSGRKDARSTELLASEQMERLTAELSQRYSDRIVLFDAPPLLATSEASVLSHHVGQVLMIVEAGKTRQSAVKEAVSRLDKNKVIGIALNKSRGSYGSDYYSGGYYESYGY